MKSLNPVLKTLIYAATVIAALFLLPFVLKLFLPFLLAFAIAAAAQKTVRFLERKMKVSRGISSALLIVISVAAISTLAALLIYQLFVQTKELLTFLPQGMENLKGLWASVRSQIDIYRSRLSPEVSASIDSALDSVFSSVQNMSQPLIKGAVQATKSFVFSLPNIFAFLTVFLLAVFFFTKDYTQVINFMKDALPEKLLTRMRIVKNTAFGAFFKYVKAQLILMCITFALSSASLWVLGIAYPLVIGLIIGAVDALPFFGTGIILLPWAAAEFLQGDLSLAAGLVITHFLCQLTRQLLEPRIVSAQIGVHPILTLISVYVGLKLFGIAGMLLAPAVTLLCVNFYVSYRNGQKL